jgi:hypothetical protein
MTTLTTVYLALLIALLFVLLAQPAVWLVVRLVLVG